MKTVEPRFDMPAAVSMSVNKICPEHLDKLAIVYVRQSSPQQVLENRESTARQYALADYAQRLGWPAERVLIIDQDQGQSGTSAEHRQGFQQLLAEVTMDHAGIVLGLEMSRLARNSKDWHHLLEVCAIFNTLLGDQDGIYDAQAPNDRLLLGLRGTMSEVELHTMRNRLERGRLNKAARGELFYGVPMGYVRVGKNAVEFDPDEQARDVMHLIFDTFDDIGSLYGLFQYLIRHNIRLPVRAPSGPNKGQLDWRRASLPTLSQVLHHPMYAGAYAHGRRPRDPKSAYPNGRRRVHNWLPMEQWRVLIKDHVPAYIPWQRYLNNLERLQQNQTSPDAVGTVRQGCALLPGLLVCGGCGRKMKVSYRAKARAYYGCMRHLMEGVEQACYGLQAGVLDALIAQQVLLALQPAALELSLQACGDIEQERQRLHTHWQQTLQRAQYDVDVAQRRYQHVDPANRLVASTLERQWEQALIARRQLQEDYDRFQHQSPSRLSEHERARIRQLAADIPTLWHSTQTTNKDRQTIVRCVLERVVVHVPPDSEVVEVTLQWAGGHQTRHQLVRPVATYAQLQDFEGLMRRITTLRQAGHTASRIAKTLNAEGWYPPKREGGFTAPVVYQLLKRRGLIGDERAHDELLAHDEWWLADLARQLRMSHGKLRDWAVRGWVHSRQTPVQQYWIIRADRDELGRLGELLASSRRGGNGSSETLTRPKKRPATGSRQGG
jgi:DNA invertase Pin-like site-specific DNA recombinase